MRILLPRVFIVACVSLGCDTHSRHFALSDLANRCAQYGVDVSSLASVTIACSSHATRYPIVCYYSYITRYRRAHVVPFARLICDESDTRRKDPASSRADYLGCESGDERRRLYIKIAFKVGRPRYRFLDLRVSN